MKKNLLRNKKRGFSFAPERILKNSGVAGAHARLARGFTLVELLVAMGIFSVVILLGVGGFARALRTQRQVSAFSSANGNMSLVLEQIAREVRTGINFCANGTVCGSSSVLSFINAKGDTVTYCFDAEAVGRFIGNGSCGNSQKLTADSISVQYLTFIISGNQDDDGRPPLVTILTGANPRGVSGGSYTVRFETTVSSRVLDG
ncbi:MAG: type II secretion system protein [Candidatus Liptonbacteria bacterium]|nr:type II secretion system protein [Candidatus Liptonbacteria bacterium]